MWPLYVLLSKFLGTEEDNTEESGRDRLCLVESLLFKQSLGHGAVSGSHFVEVPHINQLHSWDCGLACVLMVLRTLGIKDCNVQELEELCCTTSIWTVDLAYLLQKFSVNFSYFTVTLGANPSFSVETFYKEQLSNDLVRVDMLFQKARDAGINIEATLIAADKSGGLSNCTSILIESSMFFHVQVPSKLISLNQFFLKLTLINFNCTNLSKRDQFAHRVAIFGRSKSLETEILLNSLGPSLV